MAVETAAAKLPAVLQLSAAKLLAVLQLSAAKLLAVLHHAVLLPAKLLATVATSQEVA